MSQVQVQGAETVIIQTIGQREFHSGLCGCFEDCSGCIFAAFLFPCFLCSLAGKMDECCCVPFVNGGLMAMRTKLRTQYGIRGSICEDCCYITWCGELAACQLDRELKHVGM